MAVQIVLGTALMLMTIVIGGLSLFLVEALLERSRDWLVREPHWPRLLAVTLGASLWALAMITVGVWVWALAFRLIGVFPDLEQAVYFALVSFTTLGYGDVLLPVGWRILGGMAAANGLLNFGLMTAVLVEALRDLRLRQTRLRRM